MLSHGRRALIPVLCTVALASCTTPPLPATPTPGRAVRAQPDDSDLAVAVPAGVETVLEVDLVRLRSSAWSRPALETTSSAERAERAELIGYDEVADADRMVIAGGPGAGSLTVVQGRLQRDRVTAAFRGRHPGTVEEQRQGLTVLRAEDAALAFLTARTFVSGSPDAVLAAVDCAFGLQPDVRHGQALGDLRRELSTGGGAALRFFGLVTDDMRRQAGREVPIPPELGRIGARIDLGDGMSLYGVGTLADARAADQMARQLLALARSLKMRGLAMLLGLGRVLDQVRISAQGSRVVLRLELGAERREELLQGLSASGLLRAGAAQGVRH